MKLLQTLRMKDTTQLEKCLGVKVMVTPDMVYDEQDIFFSYSNINFYV